MRKLKKYIEISLYNTNDPILEQLAEHLKSQDQPKMLRRDLELLRKTAAHHRLVSLSANQIRMQHRAFAILKEPLIQTGKWKGYDNPPEDY